MLRFVFDISRKEKFDEHAVNVGNAQEADESQNGDDPHWTFAASRISAVQHLVSGHWMVSSSSGLWGTKPFVSCDCEGFFTMVASRNGLAYR